MKTTASSRYQSQLQLEDLSDIPTGDLAETILMLRQRIKEDSADLEVYKEVIFNRFSAEVGDGPSFLVTIPEWMELDPVLIKAYAQKKHEESIITNIDFNTRTVTMFTPRDYQKFTFESRSGTVTRRISSGKTWLDEEALKEHDKKLFNNITRAERVLDEDKLEKALSNPRQRDVIEAFIRAKRPTLSLVAERKQEDE